MRFAGKNKPPDPGFQLAPMVDVIFIILSFFIAIQVYARWEKDMDIKLPTADTSTQPRQLPGEITVNVNKAGELVVNEVKLKPEQLKARLDKIVKLFPGQPVLIRADKRTAYQHVISVLDICRSADIWNISFATAGE